MDVAAAAVGPARRRLVELFDQGARQRQPRRVGGAHHDGVAARLGHQGGAIAAVAAAQGGRGRQAGLARHRRGGGRAAATGFEQPRHQRRQVGGHGVLQAHHLDPGGAGHVQRGDDAAQPLQVVAVVGDHQRIGAGPDVDGVVGADQRPQDGHQVVGVLVRQAEDLGLDLAAAAHRAGRHRAALQLGLALGQHQHHAGVVDQREALRAQLGAEQAQRVGGRDRRGAGQRQRAAHAWVDHHVAAGQRGHGARHGVDLGVGEVQRDLAAAGRRRAGGWLRQARRQRQRAGQRQQQGGESARAARAGRQGSAGQAWHGRGRGKSDLHCSKWRLRRGRRGQPKDIRARSPWRRPSRLSRLASAPSRPGSALASP